MTTTKTSYRQKTETAISDARTAIVNLYDEDLPEVKARDTAEGAFDLHDGIEDRLNLAMKKLDEASDMLREFGWQRDRVVRDLDEARQEVAIAQDQIDALSFTNMADTLLRELQGRMMNQDPKNVVWWIEAALTRIADTPDPDHLEDTTTLLNEATWRN